MSTVPLPVLAYMSSSTYPLTAILAASTVPDTEFHCFLYSFRLYLMLLFEGVAPNFARCEVLSLLLANNERAGSGCLNSFPRKISGVPPGLVVVDRRWSVATQGGRSPTGVATDHRRRKISGRRRERRRKEVSLVRRHPVKAGVGP
jgi:hypothetical protein